MPGWLGCSAAWVLCSAAQSWLQWCAGMQVCVRAGVQVCRCAGVHGSALPRPSHGSHDSHGDNVIHGLMNSMYMPSVQLCSVPAMPFMPACLPALLPDALPLPPRSCPQRRPSATTRPASAPSRPRRRRRRPRASPPLWCWPCCSSLWWCPCCSTTATLPGTEHQGLQQECATVLTEARAVGTFV